MNFRKIGKRVVQTAVVIAVAGVTATAAAPAANATEPTNPFSCLRDMAGANEYTQIHYTATAGPRGNGQTPLCFRGDGSTLGQANWIHWNNPTENVYKIKAGNNNVLVSLGPANDPKTRVLSIAKGKEYVFPGANGYYVWGIKLYGAWQG